MDQYAQEELNTLLNSLPVRIESSLRSFYNVSELLEIVLDLGRPPEARFPDKSVILHDEEVEDTDLQYVTDRIGQFGDDNRAGIERTLHRISAIRNRTGKIIGLTCRVGRAIFGTIKLLEDLIYSGKSVLLLGRPGVGKTTMLREISRVLSIDAGKRVIIVDTSNEIAGDGDIPHSAIGNSRRMQVITPSMQHSVMIEAVENHMPEVIVIDEMGTELEALAARTIAERGVQLIATAHGNSLENLILNPTLCDLIGGIQNVTLGDEEARRRRTQKTVRERKAPPTFDVVVEIESWYKVSVHDDVGSIVDSALRGLPVNAEERSISVKGDIAKHRDYITGSEAEAFAFNDTGPTLVYNNENLSITKILPFGISKGKVNQVAQIGGMPIKIVDSLSDADIILTTKQYFRQMPKVLKNAEELGTAIFVLRRNTPTQIREFLSNISRENGWEDPVSLAMREAESASFKVYDGGHDSIVLTPQISYIRRIQHQIANDHSLSSISEGNEPYRRVTISRK
jgi:stage III sporulation protein SpoIIIAA